MNKHLLSVTLLASVSFGLNGCSTMRNLIGGDADHAAITPAPTAVPEPAAPSCDHSERDLTRPWALRRYWCDGQAAVIPGLPAQTRIPPSVPADQDLSSAPIWFARGYRDLGPDGLRRTARLAEHLKQTLREGQTVWLRGSTHKRELSTEGKADMAEVIKLSFDRAWAVRVVLQAQGVDTPIRIRRPNGALYGRKVLVSVL